jgi:hypothetical protein
MIAALLLAAAVSAPAPTVDSIVADYVATRGGLAKIRAVKTLRQTGHASTDGGRQAAITRELARPDKSRFEFTVQGMTAVYVVNAGKGWQVSPYEGMTVKPLSDDAVADAMEQADIEGPLVDWKAKGHTLELAGTEKVAGREAYKLKLTLKDGSVRHEYIDVATHRQVRTEATREVRGHPVHVTATFSGHKMTGGVLFPSLVEVEAEGRPQKLRIVVDKVEVNPKLSPKRFERAAGNPGSP